MLLSTRFPCFPGSQVPRNLETWKTSFSSSLERLGFRCETTSETEFSTERPVESGNPDLGREVVKLGKLGIQI